MSDNAVPITGINHVNLYSRDIERAVAFYHDVLGFRVVVGIRDDYLNGEDVMPAVDGRAANRVGHLVRPRHYMLRVSDSGYIAFFDQGPDFDGPSGGFHHLAFAVADETDLDRVLDRLRGHDVPVSKMMDHGTFKSVYFMDPDGRNLEVTCQLRALGLAEDFTDPDLLPIGRAMRAAAEEPAR